MFTIFGATGNTGSVVASDLLAKGRKVRVVVRSADKAAALAARGAEVAIGDVLDADSVARALDGAEGAYVLVPPDLSSADLVGRGRRVVDGFLSALRKHPVKHAVLLSSVGAHEPAATGPIVIIHDAEKRLATSPGTAFTFLRAAYFMENVLAFAHPIKQDGVLPVFGGGEGFAFPMVATEDIGHVAAEALAAGPRGEGPEIIELSGPKEYSFSDAAALAGAILGRPVGAQAVPIEGLVPTMTGLGISQNVASLYEELTRGLGTGLVRFEGKGRAARGKVPLERVLEALRG